LCEFLAKLVFIQVLASTAFSRSDEGVGHSDDAARARREVSAKETDLETVDFLTGDSLFWKLAGSIDPLFRFVNTLFLPPSSPHFNFTTPINQNVYL